MLVNNKFKLLASVLLLSLLLPVLSPAQVNLDSCDSDFVSLRPDELIIDVNPTGKNDTVNIQCALDVASASGVPIVSLAPTDFFISHVYAERFNGSLQGTTRASTHVSVIDDSIDCVAMRNQGLTPAAIKFSQGEPNLKFMAVSAASPCMTDIPLDILIHFTGKNATDPACNFSVINGRVDRVDVLGSGPLGNVVHGIAASAEGELLGGCNVALLGGFKLNKSSVSDFILGVLTSMRSGAQVDINFNTFMRNFVSLDLLESNQSTTVTTNEFYFDDAPPIIQNAGIESGSGVEDIMENYAAGILAETYSPMPPAKTRIVIDNNKFYFSSSSYDTVDAVRLADFFGGYQTISAALTNNVFDLSGPNIAGIWIDGLDNVNVSANRFNGSGYTGVGLSTYITPASSGSTITANMGFATFNGFDSDIRIENGVTNTIVGKGQDPVVNNQGMGNTILSVAPVGNDAGLQAGSHGKAPISGAERARAAKVGLERLNRLRRRN